MNAVDQRYNVRTSRNCVAVQLYISVNSKQDDNIRMEQSNFVFYPQYKENKLYKYYIYVLQNFEALDFELPTRPLRFWNTRLLRLNRL